MRLTCPRCSTEYEIPDTALAAGRRLRCDRCGHEWRQEAEPAPEPAPTEPEAPEAPEIVKPERVTTGHLQFLTKRDARGDLVEGGERRRGIGVESQLRRPARNGRSPRRRILLLVALIVIVVAFFAYRSF